MHYLQSVFQNYNIKAIIIIRQRIREHKRFQFLLIGRSLRLASTSLISQKEK
jgi:hypothetical protein